MNRYGRHVRDHYRQFLPARYARIEDPEAHFSTLGQQIEDEIQATETQLTGTDPAAGSYLDEVGRLNSARSRAEELVLARFLPEPEPDPIEDLDDPEVNPAATQMLAWSRQDQQDRSSEAQITQQRLDRTEK